MTDFSGPTTRRHPLRFVIFLPPMHPTGKNPTLTLHRDLEPVAHLDRPVMARLQADAATDPG